MKKINTPEKYGRRALLALVPAALLAYTLIFIGPLDILNSNQVYVPFSASAFFWPMLLLAIATALVLAALMGLCRGRVYAVTFSLIAALAVMAYLQGLFFNGELTTLDGSVFQWRDDIPATIRNGLLWLFVLGGTAVLSLFFFKEVRLLILVLCAAAFVSQSVGLISSWSGTDSTSPNWQLDGSTEMELSSRENIIVITLDQTSPLIFEMAIEGDEALQTCFKDFEYFDNMGSEYSLTFPSLCFLLTNERFDGSIPTLDYFRQSWSSEHCENIYTAFHERNYEVKLYVESNYAAYSAENMVGKADNVVQAGRLTMDSTLIVDALELSLYRYCPRILKTAVCISTTQVTADATYDNVVPMRLAADFYDALAEGLTTQDEKNCFVWYHLDGSHFPYTVGYDGVPLGYETEQNSDNRVAQLHGYLTMVADYLEQLKALDLYDDATIIISTDHGYYECYQAMFMIKQPGQSFETMRVNSAPVTQGEVMPTILQALGADYSDYGTTVYDWQEGDERQRSAKILRYIDSYPEVDWIGNIDQWETTAHGWHRYNVFAVLNYTGDREELKTKQAALVYTKTADEFLPLTDSFY